MKLINKSPLLIGLSLMVCGFAHAGVVPGSTFACSVSPSDTADNLTILYGDATDITFIGSDGFSGNGKETAATGDIFALTFENLDGSTPQELPAYSSLRVTMNSDQTSVTQVEELDAHQKVTATFSNCAADDSNN